MWIKNERTLCRCVNKNTWFDVLFLCLTIFLLFFALSSFLQKDFHRIGLRARHRLNKPQFYSHTIPNQTKPSQAKSRERHNIFFEIERISDFYITHTSTSDLCVAFSKRDLCKSIFGISTDETNLIGHVRYKTYWQKDEMSEWVIYL